MADQGNISNWQVNSRVEAENSRVIYLAFGPLISPLVMNQIHSQKCKWCFMTLPIVLDINLFAMAEAILPHQ